LSEHSEVALTSVHQHANPPNPECNQAKVWLNTAGPVATPNAPKVFGELMVKEIARWNPVMTSGEG
jgi:hypothetical protein